MIPIECFANQLQRQLLPVVAHGFGKNAGVFLAQLQRQLAHPAIRIVPAIPSTQKANHQCASARQRQRSDEIGEDLRRRYRGSKT